jgi:hypothetical protein
MGPAPLLQASASTADEPRHTDVHNKTISRNRGTLAHKSRNGSRIESDGTGQGKEEVAVFPDGAPLVIVTDDAADCNGRLVGAPPPQDEQGQKPRTKRKKKKNFRVSEQSIDIPISATATSDNRCLLHTEASHSVAASGIGGTAAAQPATRGPLDATGAANISTIAEMQDHFAQMQRCFNRVQACCVAEATRLQQDQKRLERQQHAYARHRIVCLRGVEAASGAAITAASADDVDKLSPNTIRGRQETSSASATGICKLNVGGVRFHVSNRVLLRDLYTFFDGLLNSNLPLDLDDQGYIFVDRDPGLFQEILHFLRSGSVSPGVLASSRAHRLLLLDEARFFSIDRLVMELRTARGEWHCATSSPVPPLSRQTSDVIYMNKMPVGRCFASTVYCGADTILLFGGCTQSDVFLNDLIVISVIPLQSSPGSEVLEFPAAAAAASGLGSSVEQFAFTVLQPTPHAHMNWPSARSGHSMVFCEGVCVLLFGNTDDQQCTDAHMLRIGRGENGSHMASWTPMRITGDVITGRSGQAVVQVDDKFYVIGGKRFYPEVELHNDIFELRIDVLSGTVTARKITPRAVGDGGLIIKRRAYHSAVAYGSDIFVFGGIVNDGESYSADFCVYNTLDNTWRNVSDNGNDAAVGSRDICRAPGTAREENAASSSFRPSPRSGHRAVVHKNAMYVFGTYAEPDRDMQLFRYDFSSKRWSMARTAGCGPTARAVPCAVMLPEDVETGRMARLFLYGGIAYEAHTCLNDVFTLAL